VSSNELAHGVTNLMNNLCKYLDIKCCRIATGSKSDFVENPQIIVGEQNKIATIIEN